MNYRFSGVHIPEKCQECNDKKVRLAARYESLLTDRLRFVCENCHNHLTKKIDFHPYKSPFGLK